MLRRSALGLVFSFLIAVNCFSIEHIQGEVSGEVTSSSIILQSRLTKDYPEVDGDVIGEAGVGYFEISESRVFLDSRTTRVQNAQPKNDFIIKEKVKGLKANTQYFYRLIYGKNKKELQKGQVRSFKTLPASNVESEISFVHSSCMNQRFFRYGGDRPGTGPYTKYDKALGYPALEVIRDLNPDFWILNGDNVYYDTPVADGSLKPSETVAEMRKEWHQQFSAARFAGAFSNIPTYWLKDDHDYRFNDSDNVEGQLPSPKAGWRIFREQVPIVDPQDSKEKTYRTHRINKDLQLWFIEGRDYRSPNAMDDGPEKTIWGAEQKAWLKKTLLESDATFKIIIHPTPLIGPDDRKLYAGGGVAKADNHVNYGGYKYERDEFFEWAKANELNKKIIFIIGDRHWQYHSVHPDGFEEFGSGAISDFSARRPAYSGEEASTDPESQIKQLFTPSEPTGGFIYVKLTPGDGEKGAQLKLKILDKRGEELYSVVRNS